MEKNDEMFILSKFRHLRFLANNVKQSGNQMVDQSKMQATQALTEKELKAKAKADKKKMMAAQCKPSEKNEKKKKFVEKVKYKNETPEGEKKDTSKPMPDTYDPSYVESAWDSWWQKMGFFHATKEDAQKIPRDERFVMLLPPPNVTGSLHLGHTLMGAIEDSIVRWHRMKGRVSLWVPGTDHAGIATQTVVERKVQKETGKYRSDFTREEFVNKIWNWKNDYGHKIFQQFRKLGVSFDLNRNFFTLDEQRSVAVKEAFVRLHERGILYRAERIVHWCCALKTAISDIELDELEIEKPTMLSVPLHKGKYEFGVLVDFAYKFKEDPSREMIISTTRIETMLADVAVAVHPNDPRYQDVLGKELIHPFFPDRSLKIIADDVLVEMDFGTGAVKITPGHDPNDFLCGQRHNLEMINIFDEEGIVNQNGGQFKGLRRYDCRNAVMEELTKLNLIKGKKPNKMVLQRCSRTEDIIEPMVKSQWWVNCKEVADRAFNDINSGKIKILPEFQKKTLNDFLLNIKDWCISRQLWWGHRCPAYLIKIPGKIDNPSKSNPDHWVAARNYDEALDKASKKYDCDKSIMTVTQDEDVLDTWFSSALLPFSVFGWPNTDSDELKSFFPTDLLETGHDIIFFWVARMIFMSYFFMDDIPFHTVFLHPIVRDSQGRKMSKALGNVVDPIEVIEGIPVEALVEKLHQGNLAKSEIEKSIQEKKREFPQGIPECGADALRLGLMSYLVQGRNINLDISRVVSYRFFGNKLWQATKFLLLHTSKDFELINSIDRTKLHFIDRWILHKLSKTIEIYDRCFKNYNFGEATNTVYSFWLDNLCPIYFESCKPILNSAEFSQERKNLTKNVLLKCIDSGLKLLHPLMPFITEELYQRLPKASDAAESVCLARLPEDTTWYDHLYEEEGDRILGVVRTVLSVISQLGLNKIKPCITVFSDNKADNKLFQREILLIKTLTNSAEVKIIDTRDDASLSGRLMTVVNSHTDVYLDIKQHIDVKKEIERLEKSLKEKEKYVTEYQTKMLKPGYDKVPESVKQTNSEKLEKGKVELQKVQDSIKSLQEII